jgi:repressor LexA
MNNNLGKYIKEKRHGMGLSLREFGKRCDLSHTHVDSLEKGYDYRTKKPVNITNETFQKLAKGLGVNESFLVDLSLNKDTENTEQPKRKSVKIPVLGVIAAGVPIEAVEDIIDYEEITEELAARGEYFALRIQGDSMEPRIKEGDVVIVRRQPDVESGDVAVVYVNGYNATVKKITKHEEGISLIPFNTAYSPKFFTYKEMAELPIIIHGKVVELRGKF